MATFSKRHYEAVARSIKEYRNDSIFGEDRKKALMIIDGMQYKLMCLFTADNPRFNAERFNKACGGEL